MRIFILVLSLVAALLFGAFVPQMLTDDLGARLVIAFFGGFTIGIIGALIAQEVD